MVTAAKSHWILPLCHPKAAKKVEQCRVQSWGMSFATLLLCRLGVLELNGKFCIRRTKHERVLGKKLHEVFLMFGNTSVFWNSLLPLQLSSTQLKKFSKVESIINSKISTSTCTLGLFWMWNSCCQLLVSLRIVELPKKNVYTLFDFFFF